MTLFPEVTAATYPPDYEAVPTMPELQKRGLALIVAGTSKGAATHYRATPEGQQLINDTMKRNAARCKAWDEQRRAARVKGAA